MESLVFFTALEFNNYFTREIPYVEAAESLLAHSEAFCIHFFSINIRKQFLP
jgi:hypothetical protein